MQNNIIRIQGGRLNNRRWLDCQYRDYENAKREIKLRDLPPREYAKAIRELAERLGV